MNKQEIAKMIDHSLLHPTLTDEELDKYNKYNEESDQIEFEIAELEKAKVDVFDLKMELKLVKDKIMTGNFAVVDIYLQGLRPRLEQQWKALGKVAPKLQKKLANLDEIKKSEKGSVIIFVDTDTSKDNVSRAATSQGWEVNEVLPENEGYRITISRN